MRQRKERKREETFFRRRRERERECTVEDDDVQNESILYHLGWIIDTFRERREKHHRHQSYYSAIGIGRMSEAMKSECVVSE